MPPDDSKARQHGTIDATPRLDRPASLDQPAASETAAKVRWAIFIAMIVLSVILLSLLIASRITGLPSR